ncbi:MAG: flagellar biosynthetic protein FliQ [Myxococcales bacterium]|nr:flagellar biosynthetic protein FliQ [Myxococcales bacterium]
MSDAALLTLFERALLLTLLLALPPLLMAALAGSLVGLLQARLGIHEATPPALARLLAGLLTVILLAPFLGRETLRFASALWSALPGLGSSGS